MGSNIKGITIDIGGNTTKLQKALQGVNSKSKDLQTELNQVNRLLKFNPDNTVLLSQKQKLLAENIVNTKQKLDTLRNAQQQVQQQFEKGEIGEDKYRAFQREVEATEGKLKSLQTQIKNTNDKFGDIAKTFKNVGDKATNTGDKLMPLTTVIAGVGTASVVMANQFTDAMAKVSTIADTTKVPMQQLEQQVLELSDVTGISANKIADDMYNAISAGVDTAKANEAVSSAVKLAKGGFTESSKALDVLTTVLNAYGMEAKDMTKVSDMLIQTQNKGKTTVDELSASMGKIIPTAKGQNVALEQVTTSYAIMTSKGIKTAETTTYLNSMINELGKSGTKTSDLLKQETGKSFSELMDSGASLADVLKIVDDNAKDSGLSMSDMFGSAEAGKAALTLLSDGVDNFNTGVADMLASSGATEEAFKKMQTPAEEFKIELNKLKNVGINLGDALMPVFKNLVEKIKGVVDKIKSLDTQQLRSIAKIGLVIGSIAPLLIIIGKVSTSIGAIITATQTLWAVMATNPVGAVMTAIGLLVTAISGYVAITQNGQTETDKLNQKHKDLMQSVKDEKTAWEDLKTSQQEQQDTNLQSIEHTQALWQELQTLADATGNVEEKNKTRANFIMGELNTALGTELTMTGNQIQGYKDLQAEIDKTIEKQQAQIILDARKPLYEQAILNIDTAKEKLSGFNIDIDRYKTRIDELQQKMKENPSSFEVSAWAEEIHQLQAKLEEIQQSQAIEEQNVKQYSENIQKYETDKANIIAGKSDEVITSYKNTASEISITNADNELEAKKHLTYLAEQYKEVKKQYEDGEKGVDEITVKNAHEQLMKACDEYEKVGFAIPDGIKKGINANSDMATNEVNNLVKDMKEWVINDDTGFGIHSPSKYMTDIGMYLMQGLQIGLADNWQPVETFVTDKITWLNDKLHEAIDILNDIEDAKEEARRERRKSKKIPKFAKGGVLENGQGIVGEAGAELLSIINGKVHIKPLSDAEHYRTLNGDNDNNSGSKIFNQTNNIYSPTPLSPAENARQIRRQSKRLLKGV